MSLLKRIEFIPGIKWFESEMHNTLFQHSVFGAIVFLIVSNTDVYKFVGNIIDIKDKNILQIIHAFIFAVIMYFGSMYIFGPLLGEGIVNVPSPPSGASASIDGLAASQLCRDCRNNQQTKIEIAHENGTLSNLLSSDEYQQMADGCAAKCRDYQQIG